MRREHDGFLRELRAGDDGKHVARGGLKLGLRKRKVDTVHAAAHHLGRILRGDHKARDAAELQLFIAQVLSISIRRFKRIIMHAAHDDERCRMLFTQQAIGLKRSGIDHHRRVGQVAHAGVISLHAALGI